MKSPSAARRSWLWLFVILAFLLLITAWTTLIVVAVKKGPEPIPVEPATNRR